MPGSLEVRQEDRAQGKKASSCLTVVKDQGSSGLGNRVRSVTQCVQPLAASIDQLSLADDDRHLRVGPVFRLESLSISRTYLVSTVIHSRPRREKLTLSSGSFLPPVTFGNKRGLSDVRCFEKGEVRHGQISRVRLYTARQRIWWLWNDILRWDQDPESRGQDGGR